MTRHLAIGDIHGCFHSLTTLIAFVRVGEDDILVTLGDYIDRGPRSREVIDWLIAFDQTNTLIPLRGNHEVMMLDARTHFTASRRWALSGAHQTLDSYTTPGGSDAQLEDVRDSHWRFLSDRLLPYYETSTHVFVHGIVDPRIPLNKQPEQMLYWNRYSDDFPGHASGKVVVCGHESQDSGLPATNGHAIKNHAHGC